MQFLTFRYFIYFQPNYCRFLCGFKLGANYFFSFLSTSSNLRSFWYINSIYVLFYLGFGKDWGESSAWAAAKSTVYDRFILLMGFFEVLFLSKAPACTSLDPNPEAADDDVIDIVWAIGELWLESPVQGANPRSTEPPVSDLDFLNRCHWLIENFYYHYKYNVHILKSKFYCIFF